MKTSFFLNFPDPQEHMTGREIHDKPHIQNPETQF